MKNQRFLTRSFLCIFTLLFAFQNTHATSWDSPSAWWKSTKKKPYTAAAIIGGTVAGATALYYYIKNKFAKKPNPAVDSDNRVPSNQYLKHVILRTTRDILEEEELKKISDSLTEEFNKCLSGKSEWKRPITEEMLKDIASKIVDQINKSDNIEDPRKKFTEEQIKLYIQENKKIFDNSLLLHLPQAYSENFKITLDTINDNIKTESSYHYLYKNNTSNPPNTTPRSGKKDVFKKIKTRQHTQTSIWNLWGLLITPNFGANEDPQDQSPEESAPDNRVRYGNLDIASPTNQVEMYKIHLMPRAEDFITLIKLIIESPDLEKLVINVKFKNYLRVGDTAGYNCPTLKNIYKEENICLCGHKGVYDVGPLIVLYTTKKHVQAALDTVCSLFKDIKGLNLIPQFNRKITSLIYYAQGNSISKIFNPELFEAPDYVHYKPNIIKTQFYKDRNEIYKEKEMSSILVQHPQYHYLKNPAEIN